MPDMKFWIYLTVTAGVTYLVRALPLVLMKGKIKNRFVLSLLYITLTTSEASEKESPLP